MQVQDLQHTVLAELTWRRIRFDARTHADKMVVKCYLTDTLNVMDRCTGISKERSKQEQLEDGMDASSTCSHGKV